MKALYSRSTLIGHRALPLLLMFLAASLLLLAFAPGVDAKGVKTRMSSETEIEPGTYSLITYGCSGANDPAATAFLKKEGSPYDISVIAPRSDNQVLAGLSDDTAVQLAKDFATCNPNAGDVEIARIVAPDGSLIGYEFSPKFLPLHSGSSDGVDTFYRMKDADTVVANVTIDPLLESNMMGGG